MLLVDPGRLPSGFPFSTIVHDDVAGSVFYFLIYPRDVLAENPSGRHLHPADEQNRENGKSEARNFRWMHSKKGQVEDPLHKNE